MGVPLSSRYMRGIVKVSRTVAEVLAEKSCEMGLSRTTLLNLCLKYVGGWSVQAKLARFFNEHEARLGRVVDEKVPLNTYYCRDFIPTRRVSEYVDCSVRFCFGLVVDEGASWALRFFKPPFVSDEECVFLVTKRFNRRIKQARCSASKKERVARCDKCLYFTARNGTGLLP